MKSAGRWLLSIFVAGIFLLPLLWMLGASFSPEAEIFRPGGALRVFGGMGTWENYLGAWRRSALGLGLLNSLLQVFLIAGVGLFVNAAAAYAFARIQFPGRDVLFAVVVMLVVLPLEVLAVPMFLTARDLGLTGGYAAAMTGLTLPFVAKAFNIYFLRQQFLALPTALEEAAVIDGAGTWRQFWSIGLPLIRPALATVVVLDLLTHWGDFLWPLMISTREETRTVQLSLANLFTQPPIRWGDILACAVMATLPVMAIFHWLQRYLVASDSQTGIK